MYSVIFSFFFFNDTATTEIYTLSLHDALPICIFSPILTGASRSPALFASPGIPPCRCLLTTNTARSEEHTSELQSRSDLVCRLLLEKKKKRSNILYTKSYTNESSTSYTRVMC